MLKIILTCLVVPLCYAAPIEVISAKDGKALRLGKMTHDQYVQTLLHTRSGLDKEIIASLPADVGSAPHWKLEKISAGLGVSGKVGFGPFKFGTTLKQRFVYAR